MTMTEEDFRKAVEETFYGKIYGEDKFPQRKISIQVRQAGMKEFDKAMKKEAERLYKKLFTPEEQFQQDLSDIRKMLYEEDPEPSGTHEGTSDEIQCND